MHNQPARFPHVFRFGQLRSLIAGLFLLLGAITGRATTVVPPEFVQLVNESDYIVRAVVKSVTLVELDVREVVAGTPPQPLVLQMLGGRVGEEALMVSGAPQFKVGQEDILFVQGNGRNISPLYAMMHGRYPILKESTTGREYVARSNQVPLQDTAEIALPMADGGATALQSRLKDTAQALTPTQFIQQVKAAVNPSYNRAHLQ